MLINRTFLSFLILILIIFGACYLIYEKIAGSRTVDPRDRLSTCTYNGKIFKSGEGFPSTDGCNSCSCQNGQVTCTTITCENQQNIPPTLSSCTYNGITYQSGQGFKSTDGCNNCSCEDGMIACTTMACR